MGKRRKLSKTNADYLRQQLNREARTGYATYRYGSTKPVSLPRIFTGQKRQHMVGKVMDLMRDWRYSPFEHEGAARAGVRTALVLDGKGWHQADFEAEALVGEALHLMGAKRPSEAEAAPEYTIAKEHCANCHGPLDDESIANHERFCCPECRTAMRTYRNARYWLQMTITARWAYEVARREGIPERDCQWCGRLFKPATPETVTCSRAHAAKLREQKAGRGIPMRACENPACGKQFQPSKRVVKYCCDSCFREHQAAISVEKLCENPACGKPFKGRYAFQKYCGGKCRDAMNYKKPLPARRCLRPSCGREFIPKKSTVMFCDRICARNYREDAKASAFICEEVKKAA